MKIDPAIEDAIARHPRASARTIWRHDDAGTTVRNMLTTGRQLTAITPYDVDRLIEAVASAFVENRSSKLTIGNVEVAISGNDILIGKRRYESGARIPGLYQKSAMPREPWIHDHMRQVVEGMLKNMGIEHAIVKAGVQSTSYATVSQRTRFIIATPERAGDVYEIDTQFEHRPDTANEDAARKVAQIIASRIANKKMVASQRAKAEGDMALLLKGKEGLRVVGSAYRMETWRLPNAFNGTAYALVESLGATLKPRITHVSPASDESVKHLLKQHRLNAQRLATSNADDALACDAVLANAVIQLPDQYAPHLLLEFESVLAGKSIRTEHERRRGITVVSITRGVVKASVRLGKGVRHHKNYVAAEEIKKLPETMIAGMVGRPMRSIVDHSYLEGLAIKTASITNKGLTLRPHPATVPLAPVLKILRAKAARHRTDKEGRA